MRRALSALLWLLAAGCAVLAARVAPRVRRYEVVGVTVQPISELPREQILRPPREWVPTLVATHRASDLISPRARA